MILHLHSNTSYFTKPKASSLSGGYFYMGNKTNDFINGPILNPTGVIRAVVSSAAEAQAMKASGSGMSWSEGHVQ